MPEPLALPSYDDLDELVDTDPIRLRNKAWELRREVAESIVERNALTKRAEAAEAEVARLKAENAHLDREWQSRGTKVIRLDEELRQARNRLWEVAKVRVWTNEEGKGFVFADDLRRALGEAASE